MRHDGGHKHDYYVTDTLGEIFDYVAICPEVEVGMGTPREAIHLAQEGKDIKLVGRKSKVDHTDSMLTYANKKVEKIADENISGYILKKDSPSCGLERVRVHHGNGWVTRTGIGLFTSVLLERFPNLPIEEEGRLCDPKLRENWIERVFAYHRLQALWASRWRIKDLVEFHTQYKLVLLAHSPQTYQQLGRLVANSKSRSSKDLAENYEREFMEGLKKIATCGRHANVLQHMFGYFRDELDESSRKEILECIEDYRHSLIPLIVPITLVGHYVRKFNVEYLMGQMYLNPHPKELALRNHV